jgi:hypothetical protein
MRIPDVAALRRKAEEQANLPRFTLRPWDESTIVSLGSAHAAVPSESRSKASVRRASGENCSQQRCKQATSVNSQGRREAAGPQVPYPSGCG